MHLPLPHTSPLSVPFASPWYKQVPSQTSPVEELLMHSQVIHSDSCGADNITNFLSDSPPDVQLLPLHHSQAHPVSVLLKYFLPSSRLSFLLPRSDPVSCNKKFLQELSPFPDISFPLLPVLHSDTPATEAEDHDRKK